MGDRTDREVQGAGQEREVPDSGTGGEEVRPVEYLTIFSADVDEFLEKLPEDIRNRIVKKIRQASKKPEHFFERLHGRTDYKLRVGSYRVVADIQWGNRLIILTAIGHRRDIYDKG